MRSKDREIVLSEFQLMLYCGSVCLNQAYFCPIILTVLKFKQQSDLMRFNGLSGLNQKLNLSETAQVDTNKDSAANFR